MTYLLAFKAFTTIYVVTCTNIESFADDISMNVVRLNVNIAHGTPIENDLNQFIRLHLRCYK